MSHGFSFWNSLFRTGFLVVNQVLMVYVKTLTGREYTVVYDPDSYISDVKVCFCLKNETKTKNVPYVANP